MENKLIDYYSAARKLIYLNKKMSFDDLCRALNVNDIHEKRQLLSTLNSLIETKQIHIVVSKNGKEEFWRAYHKKNISISHKRLSKLLRNELKRGYSDDVNTLIKKELGRLDE